MIAKSPSIKFRTKILVYDGIIHLKKIVLKKAHVIPNVDFAEHHSVEKFLSLAYTAIPSKI